MSSVSTHMGDSSLGCLPNLVLSYDGRDTDVLMSVFHLQCHGISEAKYLAMSVSEQRH